MRTLDVNITDYNVYSLNGVTSNSNGKIKGETSVTDNTLKDVLPKNEETKESTGTDIRYVKKDGSQMSEEEIQQLQQLQQRDQEVRAHESAHIAVGGQYVSAAKYSFETGPDGKSYAVGGEVGIDVSEIPNKPEATIIKMQIVKSAALAPKDPSAQDYAVASEATTKSSIAQSELRQKTVDKFAATSTADENMQSIDMIA